MFKHYIYMFIVNLLLGLTLNPMNLLAYKFSDLFLSLTLFYGALIMSFNMIWSHEIISYMVSRKFNVNIFLIGLMLFFIVLILMRTQFMVTDNEYLKRMISHHSTAITTSKKIIKKTNNKNLKTLAKEIIDTQEKEIILMKKLLEKKFI